MNEVPDDGHLDAMEVAAFVSATLDASSRTRVVDHLNICRECRDEIADASRLASAPPSRRYWWASASIVIAASLFLVVLLPRVATRGTGTLNRATSDSLRGATSVQESASAPRPLMPRDEVDRVDRLVWSDVGGAVGYRVRLYNDSSSVLWSISTKDTVVLLPDSVHLRPQATYFWIVEASIDWQRWVSSDLIAFTISGARR